MDVMIYRIRKVDCCKQRFSSYRGDVTNPTGIRSVNTTTELLVEPRLEQCGRNRNTAHLTYFATTGSGRFNDG